MKYLKVTKKSLKDLPQRKARKREGHRDGFARLCRFKTPHPAALSEQAPARAGYSVLSLRDLQSLFLQPTALLTTGSSKGGFRSAQYFADAPGGLQAYLRHASI